MFKLIFSIILLWPGVKEGIGRKEGERRGRKEGEGIGRKEGEGKGMKEGEGREQGGGRAKLGVLNPRLKGPGISTKAP